MKRVIPILLAIVLTVTGACRLHAQKAHRTLIFPVEFSDLKFSTPPETIDSIASELAAYYKHQFRDSLDFIFDIAPINSISGNYSIFGSNTSYKRDALAYKMALNVYRNNYGRIDYSVYDNDKDGFINDIIFITPGISEAAGGGENQFWPEYSELEDKDIPYSLRYKLKGFALVSEFAADSTVAGIGVIAHEFGHILGLKDMYDTDGESSGGLCPGLGNTSLMALGLNNDGGRTPPNLNAIEREILKIGRCEVLDNVGDYTLEPIHLSGRFFKIPTYTENRYYLLENRKAEGRDAFIGGEGMLIYKVDKSDSPAGYSTYFQRTLSALQRWQHNQVNCNPEYPCAAIIPAQADTADSSMMFWPQDGKAVFSPGRIAITDITRSADGHISFKAVEPLKIDGTSVFQSSAIIAWSVSAELGAVDSCKLEWSAQNSVLGRVDGIAAGDSRYCYTIKGLSPRTTYRYTATVYYSDGASYSAGGTFTTRIYRNGIFRFIWLGDAPRNRDGSLKEGTAIPLIVYNCVDEEISWTFNGRPISTGPDGLWAIPGNGVLKAEITNSDGSRDVIIKEVVIK